MAQVVTDPHLNVLTPNSTSSSNNSSSATSSSAPHNNADVFEALEAQWSNVNAALLRREFKPERWLQSGGDGHNQKEGAEGLQKPSGLLTFRYIPSEPALKCCCCCCCMLDGSACAVLAAAPAGAQQAAKAPMACKPNPANTQSMSSRELVICCSSHPSHKGSCCLP